MKTSSIPPRVAARPAPSQWDMDEVLTLPEAVALFWPHGPLTLNSLRRAVAKNQLPHVRIQRKLLTTRASILRLTQCATGSSSDLSPGSSDAAADDQAERERLRQAVYGRRRRGVRA